MKQILAFVCAILLVSSCGGTGSPNPPTNANQYCPPGQVCTGGATISAIYYTVYSLCTKISSCQGNQISISQCTGDLTNVENIDEEIGIPQGQYSTLEDAILAEVAKEITPDFNAQLNCNNDIDALACEDPTVSNAWNASEPDNYDNVADMIPQSAGSCPDIFSILRTDSL